MTRLHSLWLQCRHQLTPVLLIGQQLIILVHWVIEESQEKSSYHHFAAFHRFQLCRSIQNWLRKVEEELKSLLNLSLLCYSKPVLEIETPLIIEDQSMKSKLEHHRPPNAFRYFLRCFHQLILSWSCWLSMQRQISQISLASLSLWLLLKHRLCQKTANIEDQSDLFLHFLHSRMLCYWLLLQLDWY